MQRLGESLVQRSERLTTLATTPGSSGLVEFAPWLKERWKVRPVSL